MYKSSPIYWPLLFIMDAVGYILFFWKRSRSRPKNIRKALFIRLEHIGDMVMATPAFENFKKDHPKAKVHVLCRKLALPVIEKNPYVDKVITYEAPWMIRKENKERSLASLIDELKKEGYDIVFEMHGNPINNYIASRTGAYSVGYGIRGAGFLLNKVIAYGDKQMVMQNLALIKDFCRIKTTKTRIYYDQKQDPKVLRKFHLQPGSYIIINPLSGRKEKDLTYEEVLAFMKKNRKGAIVLTGSASEIAPNKRFQRFKNVKDITGKTSLEELFCIVRNARKVYAPDTGIVHIAKALGTEYRTIYKATDKRVWGYR